MTEVSHAWLDRVVTARQRLREVSAALGRIKGYLNRGDIDSYAYIEDADAFLDRDGTAHRYHALRSRQDHLTYLLGEAEAKGDSVGSILMGLTELLDAAEETVLNTEALLSDIDAAEDPFIDRLEEHPAYERP